MIGIIVEGISDMRVIRGIRGKLSTEVEIRKMNGWRPAKIEARIKELLFRGCEKVIILKDSHSRDPSGVRREIERKLEFGGKVKLCVVTHAIESWLLADERAIGDYLSTEVKEISEPENICKPDEILEEIFSRKDKHYYKGGREPAEIARRLDLEKVIGKCSSFREFSEIIRNGVPV